MDARRFLNDAEKAQLESAIAEAERTTSAEFVCAVATESGRYDRAESLVGLVVGVVALITLHVLTERVSPNSWATIRSVAAAESAAAVVLGFIAGSVLSSLWRVLRRPFVGGAEIEGEVARAADHVFAACRLTSTRQRGGVLLFVSLFERRVVVLADSNAMSGLGPEGLAALRDVAVAHLGAGRRLETFLAAIAEGARRLAVSLPPADTPPNALSNTLVVFHPRP